MPKWIDDTGVSPAPVPGLTNVNSFLVDTDQVKRLQAKFGLDKTKAEFCLSRVKEVCDGQLDKVSGVKYIRNHTGLGLKESLQIINAEF